MFRRMAEMAGAASKGPEPAGDDVPDVVAAREMYNREMESHLEEAERSEREERAARKAAQADEPEEEPESDEDEDKDDEDEDDGEGQESGDPS